jgi:hypothetical protein
MHVNEMRRGELRRTLERAGFGGSRLWFGEIMVGRIIPGDRARRLLERVHTVRALRFLTAVEIWATARRA